MHALEKPVWREETRDACHSTKTFENLETAANGTDISHKSFQKFRKLLNFQNANSRNSGSKVEWRENFLEKFFRKFGYTSRCWPLFWNLENVVSFASGSCQKFKPDVLVEWEAAKIDWSRRLGCGDFRGLTRLKQSLLFSSSLKKRVWRVHKFGLRWLQRLDAIIAEPPFLLLTQQTGLTSPKDWAAATSEAWRD